MTKVFNLNQIKTLSKNKITQGYKVGLVVGSFDICHLGHFNLFKLAKTHVDYLIVGLDHDKTIKLTKGASRPINNFKRRSSFLSHLSTIDAIFLISIISQHGSEESLQCFEKLLKDIKPTHIFTHPVCDRHWKMKKDLAKKLGIKLVLDKSKRINNSGNIIDILEKEF